MIHRTSTDDEQSISKLKIQTLSNEYAYTQSKLVFIMIH